MKRGKIECNATLFFLMS